MSDHNGPFLLLPALPSAKKLLRPGHDSDWFRAALTKRATTLCIPLRSKRTVQYHYDEAWRLPVGKIGRFVIADINGDLKMFAAGQVSAMTALKMRMDVDAK